MCPIAELPIMSNLEAHDYRHIFAVYSCLLLSWAYHCQEIMSCHKLLKKELLVRRYMLA